MTIPKVNTVVEVNWILHKKIKIVETMKSMAIMKLSMQFNLERDLWQV